MHLCVDHNPELLVQLKQWLLKMGIVTKLLNEKDT